jgi:hypothetical protein
VPPRRMHYLLILPLMPPGVMSERIGRPPLGVASATWDKAPADSATKTWPYQESSIRLQEI